MNKFITNKKTLYVLGIFLFIVIWEIIAIIINEKIMVFPDPISTFVCMIEIGKDAFLYKSILYSFIRMLIGFIIAFIFALILGSIAGNNKHLQTLFSPCITVLKAIPTAALVFIFLLVVGAESSPILMSALVSFPIMYESFVGGFNAIDKEIIQASKIDGANYLSSITKINLPLSKNYIFVGMSSSFALCFKISIMAEIIAGSDSYGLGNAIRNARVMNPSDMRPVFAYSLVAIIIILIIDFASKIIKSKLDIDK